MSWLRGMKYAFQIVFYALIFMYYLGPAAASLDDPRAKVRAFTRSIEFDYSAWTIDAFKIKLERLPLDTVDYLDREGQRQVIFKYISLIGQIQQSEGELSLIYSNPQIDDPEAQAEPVRETLKSLYSQREDLAPLAENVLQGMVSAIVAKMGFTPGGQPIPPVMYHSTPLPWALIVSPR
ncbi:MAG: hypothetical protein P8Y68_15030, partial [Anaerolineales bacterium]